MVLTHHDGKNTSNTLNLNKHHTNQLVLWPTLFTVVRVVDETCLPRQNEVEIGPNRISAESHKNTVPTKKTIRGAREPLGIPASSGEVHTIKVTCICAPGFVVLPILIRRTRSVSQSSSDMFVPLGCRLTAPARPSLHSSDVSFILKEGTHNAPQELMPFYYPSSLGSARVPSSSSS